MASAALSITKLQPDSWRQTLASVCLQVIGQKQQAVLCVMGKSGAGKSTIGRLIRKQGLPGIPPRHIGVIDDGVLAVRVFGLFTRRIKNKTPVRDNLAPFQPLVRNKKLIVYVKVHPDDRLDRCDVVVRMQCGDDERRRRLIQREEKGEARFVATRDTSDEVRIPADYVFDLCLENEA